MVKILLMLQVFLTHASEIKSLYCGASPASEPSLSLSNNLLSLSFESVNIIFSMT